MLIKEIWRYPVKSMAGEPLHTAEKPRLAAMGRIASWSLSARPRNPSPVQSVRIAPIEAFRALLNLDGDDSSRSKARFPVVKRDLLSAPRTGK
jgi:hypothetical protein